MYLVGFIVGGTAAFLLVPMLILMAARLIGPMKRKPRVVYSICAVVVVLWWAMAEAVLPHRGAMIICALLALLILWWGYRRAGRIGDLARDS